MRDIQARFKSLYGYYCFKIKLNYFPSKVFIEPTNVCNFKCKICPQSTNLKIPKGFMDLGLYEHILSQIRVNNCRVVLHLFGEPLLHPQIDLMIKKAKENKLNVKLHTNGSLLTFNLSKKIVDSGLDRIVFSFNGADSKETYEQICEGVKFDMIVDNIRNFLKIRQQKNNHLLRVGFELVKLNDNSNTHQIIKSFKKLFKDYKNLDFDCIPAHSWVGKFSQKLNLKTRPQSNFYAPCQHLWNEFCICWDGIVVACCKDMQRDYVIGDIKKETLLEIWNGEKIVKLRKMLIKKKFHKINLCKYCERLWAINVDRNLFKRLVKKILIIGRRLYIKN
jgi:radical SAM protein with 4Fe4S-binding SPASM domain